MSGPGGSVLSLRVTRDERTRLHAIKRDRGCANLAQTMRLLMGLPRSGPFEELDGSDDVDSVVALTKVVVMLKDRVDQQHQMLTKIARHLEIPMSERPRVRAAPKPEREVAILVSTTTVDEDLDSVFAYRGGHGHPELPDGFSRG